MNNISFGSTFNVERSSIKAFNDKVGSGKLSRKINELASNIAGKEDQFVLESNSEYVNGPMFPASIKYIPSNSSKGMQENVGTVSGKKGWVTEITDFMRKTHAEWLEKNPK